MSILGKLSDSNNVTTLSIMSKQSKSTMKRKLPPTEGSQPSKKRNKKSTTRSVINIYVPQHNS